MGLHEMELDERGMELQDWGQEVVICVIRSTFDPITLRTIEVVEESRVTGLVADLRREGQSATRVFRLRTEDWPILELSATRRLREGNREYDILETSANDLWVQVKGIVREFTEET